MSAHDQNKLEMILRECGIHARRLEHARGVCDPWFPLNGVSYSNLTDDQIAHVDQLIYRFTKLQDALGAKLFPLIAGHLREDADTMTVIDKLAQLERAHAIEDAERWQELQELRNQLAHDYEDDAENAAAYLNDLFAASASLLAYQKQAAQFTQERITTRVSAELPEEVDGF